MLRSATPLRRALTAVLAITPLAYVAGLVAMHAVLGVLGMDAPPKYAPLAALGVAGLSAVAAAVGGIPRRPLAAFVLTAFLTMIAALMCTPVTLGIFAARDGSLSLDVHEILFLPVIAILVALFGAMLSAPYGVALAAVYAALLAAMAWVRERSRLAAGATLGLIVGVVWLVVGALLSLTEGVRAAALHGVSAGVLLATLGALLSVVSALRLASQVRWLARVRRDDVAGLRVVEPTDGDSGLPTLFPFGAPGVLVRLARTDDGPFRDTELGTPIARTAP